MNRVELVITLIIGFVAGVLASRLFYNTAVDLMSILLILAIILLLIIFFKIRQVIDRGSKK